MDTASKDSKFWAFLAYLLGIIGFVLVILVRRRDKFAMFHAKQSLVLFIACVVAWVAARIISFVPFLGKLIDVVIWIVVFVLWLTGIINALKGREKQLPFIGRYAEKINI